MPMLPSGRHVGLDPSPLVALLEEGHSPVNVHHLFAIRQWPDLWPWIEVVLFVPAEEAKDSPGLQMRADALPLPPGLVPRPSGFRLDDFETLQADWTADDRAAFARFLHERAAPAFARHLAKARAVQAVVREHAYGATETLIAWWDAGVHPAQLEGWDRAEMRGRDSTA